MNAALRAPAAIDRRFHDRRDAGRLLAERLAPLADRDDVVVLALPRGGVPVAFEVAQRLRAPLDVLVVRRLVVKTGQLSVGAIATGGEPWLDRDFIAAQGIPDSEVHDAIARESRQLRLRERRYRQDRAPVELEGRTAIVVDDGLATGSSARVAVAALRARPDAPARIVVASPVAGPEARRALAGLADEIVCVVAPFLFLGVTRCYEDFSQVTDAQTRELLAAS